jgi:hypothetical protein
LTCPQAVPTSGYDTLQVMIDTLNEMLDRNETLDVLVGPVCANGMISRVK